MTLRSIFGGALMLAGATLAGSAAAQDMTLRIGTAAGLNPSIQPILYADHAKLFEKYGLKAELVNMNDSVTALQGLLAGACDILYTGAGTGMVAITKGADIKLIMSHTPWTEFVFVAPKSIKTLKDLEGKNVGISKIGALNYQATMFAFKQEGVDPAKVQLMSTGGNDSTRAAALVAKTIQGATINALDGFRATDSDPNLHVVFDVGTAFRESFMGTAVFARDDVIRKKPQAVQAAVKALIESSRQLQSDLKTATDQAKRSGLDPKAVDAVFAKLLSGPHPYYGVEGGINRKTVESTLDILKQAGDIDTTPAYDAIVDGSFVAAALKEMGPYKK